MWTMLHRIGGAVREAVKEVADVVEGHESQIKALEARVSALESMASPATAPSQTQAVS